MLVVEQDWWLDGRGWDGLGWRGRWMVGRLHAEEEEDPSRTAEATVLTITQSPVGAETPGRTHPLYICLRSRPVDPNVVCSLVSRNVENND